MWVQERVVSVLIDVFANTSIVTKCCVGTLLRYQAIETGNKYAAVLDVFSKVPVIGQRIANGFAKIA
jgi:hypothetical protein